MAQYGFKGDINDITDRQLEYIHSIIVENGFENSNVTFSPVGKAGDNYVANVKRITIEGERRSLSLVAKIAPSQEHMRQMALTALLFRNEHIMYTEVLPKLVQLQKEADFPEEEYLRYAKCYGSLSEEPNEIIILEDLKNSNFEMFDRYQSFTNDQVRSVLKNFAVYHSLSYALRQREPETFEYFKANLIDNFTLMANHDMMKMYLTGLETDTLAYFDDQENINIIKNKIVGSGNLAVKLKKADDVSKYTVIQQGDSWTNNIMFRFEGDNVKESIMIDYQLSKNNSPVADLLYMISNCTDYETRSKYFYDWIDYYHSELDKSLANFNLKANLIYPRDKLDADLKRYGKLMFGISLMLANILIRKSEETAKMMDAFQDKNSFEKAIEDPTSFSISNFDEESRTLYKKRIIGLIKSYSEYGFL